MEYILLIVIIVLLFHLSTSLKSKTQGLSEEIRKLNRKLDETLRAQRQPPFEQKEKAEKIVIDKAPSVPPTKEVVKERPLAAAEINPLAPQKKKDPPTKTTRIAAPITTRKREVKKNLWERFKEKNPDLEKFIGENLINKIGVLILVLGISYFVKFAIDKNWINEPARVGIGVLAGSLVLYIAHRLRKKYASFSSVLVAGSIAIFYFTIAIAFHEYQLFDQTTAFIIMVLITAFSCLISLSYNRIELAILSLIGGFAVPFMVSTGSGNYLVLFSYIAILDIGILTLAYFKKWHLVTILSFAFTTLLFGSWVIQEMDAETPHYLGALIFGFVFYLIFVIANIINNLRTKGTFSKAQLSILALNTFVFYGIGTLILSHFKPEFVGIFTAFLAVLNLAYALLLYKKFGLDKTAVYLLIGLTLTFITLSIPIQFSGNNITIFWAAEAVLLLWLSQKSKVKLYRFASVLVHFLMLGSLMLDWPSYIISDTDFTILLNPIFITGITVVLSLLAVAYLLRNETVLVSQFKLVFNPVTYRKIANVLAVVIGYFVGLFEVAYQSNNHFESDASLAIVVTYHLLFMGIFCFFLNKKRSVFNNKLINVLAVFNSILFAFLFSKIPFSEYKTNIVMEQNIQIAYYLHLLSFVIVGYLCYLVYSTNKKQRVFAVFNHQLAVWGAIFLLVFIASNEVLLQGVHLLGVEVDLEQFNDYGIENAHEIYSYEKEFAVQDSLRLVTQKIIKTGLPVLWGILAFVFLIIGVKKRMKQLRIIALTLLGITIVKLFVYDISNVSETGKIVSFILLGILVLIISFVYQKIKVLVIDEDKTPKNEKTD